MEDIKLNTKRIPNKIVKNKDIEYRQTERYTEKQVERQLERNKEIGRKTYTNLSRQKIGRTPRIKKETRVLHRSTIIIFIICILVGGVYFGGNLLHKADIEIKQKVEEISYKNKAFSASKEDIGDNVRFEIAMIEAKKIKSLTLRETKEVSLKSKGSVMFYNEFSTTPQTIASGSYIADQDGKTYKLDKTITIPGYKIDKDKKIMAGSAIGTLTAFLPGDQYNGSPESFFVSAFSKTAKYDKVYGKLKDPFTGGAQGLVYILSDDEKNNLKTLIEPDKDSLINQARYEMKTGYILYPDASNFSYVIDEDIMSKTPDAKITVEESLSAVILDRESLINNIIKISLPNIKSKDEIKEININDLDKLSFIFNPKDLIITKDLTNIDFFLDGNVNAIWQPDLNSLKEKLVGINKSSVSSIFKQDPGISSAVVKIFPSWKKEIPLDLSKINLFSNLTQ